MNEVRNEEYKAKNGEVYTIRLVVDEDPESPREWDNLGHMVLSHRRYDLGDKHTYDVDGSFTNLVRQIESQHGPILWMKVRMYDHSGVGLKAYKPEDSPMGYPWNCPWDSGYVGLVYIPLSKVREEYSTKRVSSVLRERVYGYLSQEVETYSAYLNGEVYGYIVEDADGNVVDSCHGFVGEDDYAMEQAREHAEYDAEMRVRI